MSTEQGDRIVCRLRFQHEGRDRVFTVSDRPVVIGRAPECDLLLAHDSSHAELVAKEEEYLGWTHPEIGELLGGQWGLPEGLTQSISVHHDQAVPGYEIAQWASLIELPEPDLDLLAVDAERRLGVADPDAVPAVVAEAMERAAEIAAIFN